MNPARSLVVSATIGLWASSASAADLRPEDAASHIGETATEGLSICNFPLANGTSD
jgi:hypothetical protein